MDLLYVQIMSFSGVKYFISHSWQNWRSQLSVVLN